MSLRSGAPTFGTPEPALAYFAIGQLARRLRVPLRCGGNLCGSKVADAQAAFESANSMWPAFMAGANFILHAAGWLEADPAWNRARVPLPSNRRHGSTGSKPCNESP